MRESAIQNQLIKKYKAQGYYVIKIIKASKSGIPDLLLIKDGVASFVEVKAPNGRISPLQRLRASQLRAAGCKVRFATQGDNDVAE